jgi:uncharacterized protein
MGPAEDTRKGMSFGTLVPFFALAFGLTWGIAALWILFTEPLAAIFGELSPTHPLYILAVYSPGIAGVFLVWRHYGTRGLGSYFRRLTLWRMPLAWWAFLLIGAPALFYLAAAIEGTIADPFPFSPWYYVLPALAVTLFIGPIEEFGWRGVALPLLQRRFAPLWAGSILGAVWGLWHLPAFLVGGTPHEAWSFGLFFIGAVALSIAMTSMFNAARGSLLIAVLFHFQLNNPIWPDAQLWATIVFGVAALAIVLLDRRAMLTRDGAVTEVLMPERKKAPTAPMSPPADRGPRAR